MLNGKKIVVVMPAYNAAETLEKTYAETPTEIVDDMLLVDDGSSDETVDVSTRFGIKTFVHNRNYGYGRNQKTCYTEALRLNADIIAMIHPDYQYTPKLIIALVSMIAFEVYDVALGSRILGGRPLKGGMPLYKYIANRFLTAFQNLLLGSKLSEFHTGYRAFSKEVLTALPLLENSDDFLFDNEILAQALYFGYNIGEISCPTKYFAEASSIGFKKSVKYGIGVILTSIKFSLQKMGIINFRIFNKQGRRLLEKYYEKIDGQQREK